MESSQALPASLRASYQHAAQAFLLKDFTTAATIIHQALATPPPSPRSQRTWFDNLTTTTSTSAAATAAADEVILRKFEILKVTLIATIYASSSPPTPSPSSSLYPSSISSLLALQPAQVISSLWSSLLSPPVSTDSTSDEIFPTPSAAFLHPSLAIALVHAALKLNVPTKAKEVAESWFGSVDESVDRYIWEESLRAPTTTSATNGNGEMNGSSILLPTPQKEKGKNVNGEKSIVVVWMRLFDLLALHVLPKLGEWEAAGDFIRSQSRENGGWVDEARIEDSLRSLTHLQHSEALAQARQLQLQQDALKRKSQPSQPSQTPSRKGKEREKPSSSSSNDSSPTQAASKRRSTKPVPAPPPRTTSTSSETTGFASLRSSLSSYLSQSPSVPSSTSTPNQAPYNVLLTYLQSTDPIRLLSIICFLFALRTWWRRRRGRGGMGVRDMLGMLLGKVGETVKMGTKVSSL